MTSEVTESQTWLPSLKTETSIPWRTGEIPIKYWRGCIFVHPKRYQKAPKCTDFHPPRTILPWRSGILSHSTSLVRPLQINLDWPYCLKTCSDPLNFCTNSQEWDQCFMHEANLRYSDHCDTEWSFLLALHWIYFYEVIKCRVGGSKHGWRGWPHWPNIGDVHGCEKQSASDMQASRHKNPY